MNVLVSTWEFKLSRFTSGTTKKTKNALRDRGDKQLEGVDYFDTYVTVVQGTTVRLMLILEMVLDIFSGMLFVCYSWNQEGVLWGWLSPSLEPPCTPTLQ